MQFKSRNNQRSLCCCLSRGHPLLSQFLSNRLWFRVNSDRNEEARGDQGRPDLFFGNAAKRTERIIRPQDVGIQASPPVTECAETNIKWWKNRADILAPSTVVFRRVHTGNRNGCWRSHPARESPWTCPRSLHHWPTCMFSRWRLHQYESPSTLRQGGWQLNPKLNENVLDEKRKSRRFVVAFFWLRWILFSHSNRGEIWSSGNEDSLLHQSNVPYSMRIAKWAAFTLGTCARGKRPRRDKWSIPQTAYRNEGTIYQW